MSIGSQQFFPISYAFSSVSVLPFFLGLPEMINTFFMTASPYRCGCFGSLSFKPRVAKSMLPTVASLS